METPAAQAGASFAPLLPWPALAAFAVLAVALLALALIRGGRGAWPRFAAAVVVLTALSGPRLLSEDREALTDVAFLIVDETESQTIRDRADRAAAAEAALTEAAAAFADSDALDLRVVRVGDADGDLGEGEGTLLIRALRQAVADVTPDRIAGAILLTDGQAHDAPAHASAAIPNDAANNPANGAANSPTDDSTDTDAAVDDIAALIPGPIHHLNTGDPGEYDRRLIIESAPAFGIVDETVTIQLRIEDVGPIPFDTPGFALVDIRVNGETVRRDRATIGLTLHAFVPLERGGANVIEVLVSPIEGEVTLRNNRAAFTTFAARDRLRVLLITGSPNAGGRAWRNLLKADPAVDLVHFTILRRPTQTTGASSQDMALIAFPAEDLFVEQIDSFDLIIFDQVVGDPSLLPQAYLYNIARYVANGGALLAAAGAEFLGFRSIAYTPVGGVLPVEPAGETIELPFIPAVTDTGERHPVTAGLTAYAGGRVETVETVETAASSEGAEPNAAAPWGPWARRIAVRPTTNGDVLMQAGDDADAAPLLILRRAGRGRTAFLASDTSWLWSRGFQGGGPQDEMLRRVAHWLMKEPELDEEALTAEAGGGEIRIERRSVAETPKQAVVATPSGEVVRARFEQVAPGLWRAVVPATENGLYRIQDGSLEALASVGPASPLEFETALSSFAPLAPIVAATEGAERRLADGIPDLRRTRDGRAVSGVNWIGLPRREAYIVRDLRQTPLAPGWLALLLAALLLLWAWRREGR